MIILGIDPGIATTGYGVIEVKSPRLKIKSLDFGCIKTSTKLPYIERLERIHQQLRKVIKKYGPDKVAVEEIFFAKNVKTALKVGEARGVILLTATQAGLPVYQFTPLQVKQALTGYGQASKMQIQKMVKIVLCLNEIPKPDDTADALAVAITCANSHVLQDKIK